MVQIFAEWGCSIKYPCMRTGVQVKSHNTKKNRCQILTISTGFFYFTIINFYTSSIKLRITLESPDASFCWSIMRLNHTARSGLNLFAEGRRWRWRNRIGLSGKLFCECKIKIYNSSTNDDIQICSTVRILRFRLSFAYKPLWIFLTNVGIQGQIWKVCKNIYIVTD